MLRLYISDPVIMLRVDLNALTNAWLPTHATSNMVRCLLLKRLVPKDACLNFPWGTTQKYCLQATLFKIYFALLFDGMAFTVSQRDTGLETAT